MKGRRNRRHQQQAQEAVPIRETLEPKGMQGGLFFHLANHGAQPAGEQIGPTVRTIVNVMKRGNPETLARRVSFREGVSYCGLGMVVREEANARL